MNDYFKAVTLGAFTGKNEERITLLLENIRKAGNLWLVIHFLLITICLNFPVTFQIARLDPNEFFNRLYGKEEVGSREEEVGNRNVDSDSLVPIPDNYGRNVQNPMIWFLFLLTLIIQTVFYLSAVFFLKLSRLNITPLSFRDRIGLAIYSSTLPVLGCSLFGLFLPTVHIIIFYFIIIFIIFQRSRLCPNG